MNTILVDGVTIEVHRKKMKNMTMRVCGPHGTAKISAPLRSSHISIQRFAETHIEWVRKHQLAYQKNHPEKLTPFNTGERHYFQGREYMLRVHEGIKRAAMHFTDDEYIDLFVPLGATQAQCEKVLMKTYRQLLLLQLDTLLPLWEERVGVKAEHYQIRLMKSRWGSCHPQTRKICLNLSLIKYPLICLEYVIVHELVHLLEASHNARFKSLMDKFMPDWRIHKALLDPRSC